MSLARRLMRSTAVPFQPGQAEYAGGGSTAKTYDFQVPAGVTRISAVAINAAMQGANVAPYNGEPGGPLHWREFDVTPLEWLTVTVGTGVGRGAVKESSVKRGGTYLVRPGYHLSLGGGGGDGGGGGFGAAGSGGLGGGAGGYDGGGGRGGNYTGTVNGGQAGANSGAGRGGDSDSVPYGYAGMLGEGTGLLGLSEDLSTSLGPKLFGGGAYWAGAAQSGGVRLLWGGGRAYPGNAPDAEDDTAATFIAAASGSSAAFTFHTGALAGDLVVLHIGTAGSGSITGVTGSANWNQDASGLWYWKQVTQADIDASIAGTIAFSATISFAWITATYRGPRVAVQRSLVSQAAANVVIPGFTKRTDCKRVLALVRDSGNSGSISAPSGFTSRQTKLSSNLRTLLADVAPASYTDGASVTAFTVADPIGTLIELY